MSVFLSVHISDFFGIGKTIGHFFFVALFSIFCFPWLTILAGLEEILMLFLFQFPITLKNSLKSPLFTWLAIIMASISILYALLRLYQLKFSPPSNANIEQRRLVTTNFITSFFIIIIFPILFFFSLNIISEISKLFFSFFSNKTPSLAFFFFTLGLTKSSLPLPPNHLNFYQFLNCLSDFLEDENNGFYNYNVIFGFIGAVAGILISGQILFYLFQSLFHLSLSYLYSPIPIFKRVYDNGLAFKSWKDSVKTKLQTTLITSLLIIIVFFILNFLLSNPLNLSPWVSRIFSLTGACFLVGLIRTFYQQITKYLSPKSTIVSPSASTSTSNNTSITSSSKQKSKPFLSPTKRLSSISNKPHPKPSTPLRR